MKHSRLLSTFVLPIALLAACGGGSDTTEDTTAGAGGATTGGSGGAAAGAAGKGGSAGQAGKGGSGGGTAGTAGAGNGGAGQAGAAGQSGTAGQSGAAGQSGKGGSGGNAAGSAGAAGASGQSGGQGGTAGSGGKGGSAGQSGSGGQSGGAGQSGNGGQSGSAGQSGSGGAAGVSGQGGAAGGTAGASGAGGAGQAGTAGAAGATAGQGGSSGTGGATAGQGGATAGQGGATAGAAGQGGAGTAGAGGAPATEICNGVDDDGDGATDEGCDDDGDGYCDATMGWAAGAACQQGDCNDANKDVHPGSTTFAEGVDYDCTGTKKYMATLTLTVDDEVTEICANGKNIPVGPNYATWTKADKHTFIMQSGKNAVGISGKDTGQVITAMAATLEVNGQLFMSNGVPGGKIYKNTDPEWNATPWRYYDKAQNGDRAGWCDATFDDVDWGPAMSASGSGSAPFQVGATSPWGCGTDLCTAFPAGKRPDWIWDPFPVSLQSAWIRIKIDLP